MDSLNFLQENWAVISAAPWAFVTFALVFGGGGFALGRWFLSERLVNLESRVARRDEEILELKSQPPTPATTRLPDPEPPQTAKAGTTSINQSVSSNNQSGGITAHTINLERPRRTLNSADGEKTKSSILRELPRGVEWNVAGLMGNGESIGLANEIRAFMRENGFSVPRDSVAQLMPMGPVQGIIVTKEKVGMSKPGRWSLIVGDR